MAEGTYSPISPVNDEDIEVVSSLFCLR